MSLLTGQKLDEARRDVARKCAPLINIGNFICRCVFGTNIPEPLETAVPPVAAPEELPSLENEVVTNDDIDNASDADMGIDVASDFTSGDRVSPPQKRKFFDAADRDEIEQSAAKRLCSANVNSADPVLIPSSASKPVSDSVSELVISTSSDPLPVLSPAPAPTAAETPTTAALTSVQGSAPTPVAAASVSESSPARPVALSLDYPSPKVYSDSDYEDVVVCLSPRSAIEVGCRMCWVERRLKSG